ncbi:hypothetical protein [Aestuariimicrobium ganziense]|uniref:hypothetical protein n=1 Tax=Aestuariimicrobium ganziense TaxID=2773677 RepID=UPI0019440407|nr:hypothetical protein [Aestuariimicrobium ganziense]
MHITHTAGRWLAGVALGTLLLSQSGCSVLGGASTPAEVLATITEKSGVDAILWAEMTVGDGKVTYADVAVLKDGKASRYNHKGDHTMDDDSLGLSKAVPTAQFPVTEYAAAAEGINCDNQNPSVWVAVTPGGKFYSSADCGNENEVKRQRLDGQELKGVADFASAEGVTALLAEGRALFGDQAAFTQIRISSGSGATRTPSVSLNAKVSDSCIGSVLRTAAIADERGLWLQSAGCKGENGATFSLAGVTPEKLAGAIDKAVSPLGSYSSIVISGGSGGPVITAGGGGQEVTVDIDGKPIN